MISKKDIEDKRRELVGYYKACEPYLTNDMRIAIKNEDVKGFGALVSRLSASNHDGTVAERDSGWEELFDFEIKFGKYLEMKSKNVKTEDINKLRQDCLLSQEDFARELGVSFATVNRWETEKNYPTYKAIRMVDDYCKKII